MGRVLGGGFDEVEGGGPHKGEVREGNVDPVRFLSLLLPNPPSV